MVSNSFLRISLGLWLCLCAAIAPLSASSAEKHSSSVTFSLGDLQRLVSEQGSVIRSFRLEGLVCAVVPERRLVALQDKSTTALLELPDVDGEVRAGDRLVIEGKNCSLIRGDVCIRIGTAPVVDNDGVHPSMTRSGKVYLPSGLQPVRLEWFNRDNGAILNLEWVGPGFPRQKVPDTVLWRKNPGLTNVAGLAHGLDYAAYNGERNFLADFENVKPVAQGVATNFDVSYCVRPAQTALFFNGFIETSRAGIYTFYLTSCDGAQLQVGEPSVSCTRLSANLALPPPATLSQARVEWTNSTWMELEGEVTFAGANQEHLEIDLLAKENPIPVTIVEGGTLLSTNLLHQHIRVRGICEFSPADKAIARFLVPSLEQVEILGSNSESVVGSSGNLLLTSVAQVKQLQPEQLAQKIPVRIKGVITGIVASGGLRLQDSTGGISVHFLARDWTHQPHVGDLVEVKGSAGPGLFAPVVLASRARYLGNGPMPEPIHPRWDQLINGSLDCEYVEIRGILLAASIGEVTLYTADGTVTVKVTGAKTDNLLPLVSLSAPNATWAVGSLVRLRGCLTLVADWPKRHLIRGSVRLISPTVAVEELAPNDPFALPTKKISELTWFDARAGALQRVKLKGQVIHAQPSEYLVLEGQRGFRVLTSQPTNALQVGDLIEAEGFPKLDGPSPRLQEAQIRKTGHAPLPTPVQVAAEQLLDSIHDSTLVQVEATLIGETIRSNERILELEAGPRHFLAVRKSSLAAAAKLAVGSRLQLIGAYASASANRAGTSTDPFSLFLIDGVEAVKVLEQPTWWTAQHALIVASILAGGLGLAFVWISLLRQKVEKRTAQLRQEIEERQRVEQKHVIEQERRRVAQDLHDDLGAGLTEINLLGTLARRPDVPAEEREGYLEQLTKSAHSLVTSLDEIVWAINPHYNSIGSIATYFSFYAEEFLKLANVTCRLQVAEMLPDIPLDSKIRHDIFLALKEALNNVVQHSGASEVILKINVAENQLTISISDNGCGFKSGSGVPGSDGLLGMRKRIEKLGGACNITSQPGQGTTVEFQLNIPMTVLDAVRDVSPN